MERRMLMLIVMTNLWLLAETNPMKSSNQRQRPASRRFRHHRHSHTRQRSLSDVDKNSNEHISDHHSEAHVKGNSKDSSSLPHTKGSNSHRRRTYVAQYVLQTQRNVLNPTKASEKQLRLKLISRLKGGLLKRLLKAYLKRLGMGRRGSTDSQLILYEFVG